MEELKIKLLLVEDDPNFGTVLKDYLTMNGYEVKHCEDGAAGSKAFARENFDICVLDVMLPKMDGFSLGEEIRSANADIPIIFLTAKTMQNDVLNGFKVGADDYITKPFNSEELLLRLKAVLKRGKGKLNNQQKEFDIGKYHYNYKTRMLSLNGTERKLSPKESELLRLLALKLNDILYREEALKMIWGRDDYFTARSMDVFITKLRKYLADDADVEIVNIHGNGFQLNVEDGSDS